MTAHQERSKRSLKPPRKKAGTLGALIHYQITAQPIVFIPGYPLRDHTSRASAKALPRKLASNDNTAKAGARHRAKSQATRTAARVSKAVLFIVIDSLFALVPHYRSSLKFATRR